MNQTPLFDRAILEDVRLNDGFGMGYFESGTWDGYDGVRKRLDRFNAVFPDLTNKWNEVTQGDCVQCFGTPCDPEENCIGLGNTRVEYFLEQQSWASDLFCFDDMLHVTRAREHMSYFISDILRPTSIAIVSNFIRKRAADHAGQKWVANATMDDFTFSWDAGTKDIFITTTAEPTSLLTPQMLQRRVQPLINIGYLGKNPIGRPMVLELSTDLETLWEMNKNATMADATNLLTHWRFMEFGADALKDYWSYGWTGNIGNYMVNTDFYPLRFNRVGANRFQVVYPRTNSAASCGIKDTDNDAYHNALYQFSFIRHRRALSVLTFNASPVNPEMPFLVRDYAGRWKFAMHDLGVDRNGCVISNKRGNKGQFIADFQMAIRPAHTEWLELIFHMRQPACVIVVPPCAPDPGYPEQDYDSCNAGCENEAVLTFTPTVDSEGNYSLAADTVTCNGVPQNHAAISSADLATLVTDLATALDPDLGTWAVAANGVQITLTGSTCSEVGLPWLA